MTVPIVALFWSWAKPYDFELAIIRMIPVPFTLVLWFYCIVFFYRYDRYSKSGIWLLLFSWIYSAYYFKNVVWKPTRELQNIIAEEPVLGNTVNIESDDLLAETGNNGPETMND